jgi:microcystin-dependent protein
MIARRQALGLGVLASLFALIGRRAARAADALTISPNGEVSMNSLAVAGPVKIDGKNALEFGAGIAKEVSAGQIAYQKHSGNALDLVGAGTEVSTRKISMWAEGGATLTGSLNVTGTVKAQSLETNSGVSLAAIQNAVNLLIPIGTMMAYGGDTNNANIVTALKNQGWLPCNGDVYSAQDYPELARVIGNFFGNLRVPDLRGRFLRGTDQGTHRDPDAASRRTENGGNAGDMSDRCKTTNSSGIPANTKSFRVMKDQTLLQEVTGCLAKLKPGRRGAMKLAPKTFTSTGSSRRNKCFRLGQCNLGIGGTPRRNEIIGRRL